MCVWGFTFWKAEHCKKAFKILRADLRKLDTQVIKWHISYNEWNNSSGCSKRSVYVRKLIWMNVSLLYCSSVYLWRRAWLYDNQLFAVCQHTLLKPQWFNRTVHGERGCEITDIGYIHWVINEAAIKKHKAAPEWSPMTRISRSIWKLVRTENNLLSFVSKRTNLYRYKSAWINSRYIRILKMKNLKMMSSVCYIKGGSILLFPSVYSLGLL